MQKNNNSKVGPMPAAFHSISTFVRNEKNKENKGIFVGHVGIAFRAHVDETCLIFKLTTSIGMYSIKTQLVDSDWIVIPSSLYKL